jgi:hypothetical protein
LDVINSIIFSQRSPVLVSILPSTTENSKWLFERRGDNMISTNYKNLKDEDEDEQVELFDE